MPTFVQTVLGTGPLVAGFALATLTIGWPIAAAQSGRVYLRIGFRRTALIGSVVVVIGGFWLLLLLGAGPPSGRSPPCCFVVGLGMGLVASPTLIAAQASVGWAERGVVTANNMFVRSIGSAVGVALFGAIANITLAGLAEPTAAAVATASHHVFVTGMVLSIVLLFTVWLTPKQPVPARDATTD